jgi:hypothetical protein
MLILVKLAINLMRGEVETTEEPEVGLGVGVKLATGGALLSRAVNPILASFLRGRLLREFQSRSKRKEGELR